MIWDHEIAGSSPAALTIIGANMVEKMAKSKNDEMTSNEITVEMKISSLESQVHYWKLKYELLEKYGKHDRKTAEN